MTTPITQPFAADLSIAELHERLGRALATGHGSQKVRAGDHSYNMEAPSPLRGLQIDDHIRRINAPPLPDTADIRALQADWDETGKLLDEATDRYRKHRRPEVYREECRQIIEREGAPSLGLMGVR